MLTRPIYRGISPILIVILLSVVAGGVFWYLSFRGSTRYQPVFIGLATGLTVALMSGAASSFITARTEARRSRDTRRTAYAEFLARSDELMDARAKFAKAESVCDAARRHLDVANTQVSLNPDEANLNARLVASAELKKAEGAFSSVTSTAQNIWKSYCAAETDVSRVVTRSVRPAFDEFRECPPEDTTARASARSKFVEAARIHVEDPINPASSR